MSQIKREDISKFLVHLTKKYNDNSAEDNLFSILGQKTIKAVNPYCLFHPIFDTMKFSEILKKKFSSVCFTETPLAQLSHLTNNKRRMLEPYGLVFLKNHLLQDGASPAIYINTSGTNMRKFLLNKFRSDFKDIKTYRKLKSIAPNYLAKIQYYSLINIISEKYNFTWEREWRINGDFKFGYHQIFAILVPDRDDFISKAKEKFTKTKFNQINKIPIISLDWNYEDIVEMLAIQLWEQET